VLLFKLDIEGKIAYVKAEVEQKEFERVCVKLGKIKLGREDCIWLYQLCGECSQKVRMGGDSVHKYAKLMPIKIGQNPPGVTVSLVC
jgi:hypothetical protein